MAANAGFLLLCVALVWAESELNNYQPELNLKDTDGVTVDLYRGFIVSDEQYVALIPELKASDRDEIGGARFICGYRLYADQDYEIPFEAEVLNHLDGKARLKVRAGFDLSKLRRNKYKFQISAFDCGSPTLHSEKVHAVVNVLRPPTDLETPPIPVDTIKQSSAIPETPAPPVETPAPPVETPAPPVETPAPPVETTAAPAIDNGGEQFFERSSYIVTVREGTLYDSILSLKPALSSSMGNICGFELVTNDVPFALDTLGNLRNTKALEYAHQKSYILAVIAKHCDGKASKPVYVNIQVTEMCLPGWKALPTSLNYRAGTKAIYPFENSNFETCDATCGSDERLAVTVSLENDGMINTCKHDTYSIQSQRDACGASPDTTELLPSSETWTANLTKVEGHDAAYQFDGKSAVKVPSEHTNHTLGNFFTFSTWMRHGDMKLDGHKEHILCNADGNQMNRHHYSLFVHNCRLVFLLRKEATEVDDLNKFQPAEWRWSIPHVCDDQWHHYALSVSYPTVKLYVDGQRVQDDQEIVEVVDDWALHPTNKVSFAQLTVGACWRGSTGTLEQYLVGYLAGLAMVTGSTETDRVIKCMNSCGEKLQFHAMDLLEVGMSVSFNTELTEITIRGSNSQDVKKLLTKVGYTNTNGSPKPGFRKLNVVSNLTCSDQVLTVPDAVLPIFISEVADPKITIAGEVSKYRRMEEYRSGIDLFTEVMILSDPYKELSSQDENLIIKPTIEDVNMRQQNLKKSLTLDRCEVRANPSLSAEHEKLRLPGDLLVQYLLDSKEFDEGFDIMGSSTFMQYEEVLRETFYYNMAITKDFTKKFSVRCYDMNGKYQSNMFEVKLAVFSTPTLKAQVIYNHAQNGGLELLENSAKFDHANAVGPSPAVVAVIVVCAVFLLAIIAIAVVRFRSVQSRKRQPNPSTTLEEGPEMEWDNSTLNITVNPLESDSLVRQVKELDNGSDSEEDFAASDVEEEVDNRKDRDLEWDNSTLSY